MGKPHEGIQHIRSAAQILATQDSKLKERLISAGNEFWTAMYNLDDWPGELQDRAERIESMILRDGPVKDSVEKMDPEYARQTAAEILAFMVEFEKSAPGKSRDRKMEDTGGTG